MRRADASTTPKLRRPIPWAVLLVVSALLTGLSMTGAASATQPSAARDRVRPDFRVATFNVLGYNHTVPGGDRKGFADGRTRTNYALRILNYWDIDVVGFQEFQTENRERFMKLTGDTWAHYPGDTLARIDMHNSIAWRTDTWQLIESHTVKIPYFFDWQVNMPYILLKHLKSGRLVWFANFHNPANSHGNAEPKRTEAMRRQVVLANRLYATGMPVVFTGDFNEREDYFCGLTRGAPMKASQGGSVGISSTCRPPTGPTARLPIDWIFGSTNLTFTKHKHRDGKLVQKTTDHPVIFADVALPPA